MKQKSRMNLCQIKLIGPNSKFDKAVIRFKLYLRVCRCSSQVYYYLFSIYVLTLDYVSLLQWLTNLICLWAICSSQIKDKQSSCDPSPQFPLFCHFNGDWTDLPVKRPDLIKTTSQFNNRILTVRKNVDWQQLTFFQILIDF